MTAALLWRPSAEQIARTNLAAFMAQANDRHGLALSSYDELWSWSVDESAAFWRLLWDFCGLIGELGPEDLRNPTAMPGAQWFPQGRVNYAQNLLAPRDEAGQALVFWGEDKVRRSVSFGELVAEVSRVQQALIALGVKHGDRVCGYMPNIPETIVYMLAATALGAVWSSASPDFGVQGVLDRFGQIEPVLMVTVDGYHYNGKTHDIRPKVAQITAQMPTLKAVVVVPYVGTADQDNGLAELTSAGIPAQTHGAFCAPYAAGEVVFADLPFTHPLFIMFSSGTTGVPKCIVHSHGGTLIQQVKEHVLHSDVHPGDRVFFFTTCGWMMWNWLVAGLAAQATLMLYDGSPFYPSGNVLFDYADAEGITMLGTSAKWIDAIKKAGLEPKATHSLVSVRAIASTGSPLVPESFDYVYQSIKSDVQLASISGGTDIVSCFMLGSPISPVYRGEIQKRGLAMAVEAWDDQGQPVRGDKGELVCAKPFPSMPIGFWKDDDGQKFRDAYFARFPNTWTHGDLVEITEHGGVVVYGRSDATLNPGGVRIGTAEIYRQVEKLDEVVEALVVGQDWDADTRVVLFVRLRDGLELDAALIDRIKKTIRDNTTPRHVPAKVVAVSDIPRTKSGKIVELAVREVVHNRPVKNIEALANPEALDLFRDRAELLS